VTERLLRTRLLQLGAVVLLVLASGPSPSAQGACDRECLRGFITQYLDALIAHKPAALPVTGDFRFTEDTVPMTLGEGLWKTASRLRPYRQEFIDVRAGVAGAHVVVEEGMSPSMVVLRLKIVGRRIAEAETMVVRNRAEGVLFEPEALKALSPAMTLVPPAAQRNTREEAIRIAQLYPAGLRAGSFVKVDTPFAPGAYRFENGRMMAGPGCTFAAGCDSIKTQRIPTLPETTSRLAAVDEELGIVWLRLDFGAGSIGQSKTAKLIVWEAFKVYGGQIHAVEAFMESAPIDSVSGWEPVSAVARGLKGPAALVGTWTLDRIEDGADGAQPVRATGRGLLIVDAAGHIFEFMARTAPPAPPGAASTAPAPGAGTLPGTQLTEAQLRFYSASGFWGNYRADASRDADEGRITLKPEGAVHPNLMGREFSRTFQVKGDRLTLTSLPGEPHTRGVTRWTWEKVAPVENLSPGYRQVAGFWQHVVEKRVNLSLGTAPETIRAPSVIVYSPSGFVGVHFPPLNRKPFASDVPTDAEARAAVQGYVGYYGALTVYPNQVFHNILGSLTGLGSGGGTSSGTTLKRFFELQGDVVEVKFPINVNQQGQQTTTHVTLKRLSGATQMLPASGSTLSR
jgi:hypothetical protein